MSTGLHVFEIIESVLADGFYRGAKSYHAHCVCGFDSEWEFGVGDAERLGQKHVFAAVVRPGRQSKEAPEMKADSMRSKADLCSRAGAVCGEALYAEIERLRANEQKISSQELQQTRRDERMQLAKLLRENADTLAKFAADKNTLVQLIALMLELPNQSDMASLDAALEASRG